MKQLEKAKSAHAGNRSEFETKLSTLRKEQAETQRKINALIDSLADFSDSTAAVHLKKRIEELNGQDAALGSRIRELESLTDNGVLGGIEFDVMRQLLTVFHDNIDDMTVTQKRAAIRTVVRKVVWDGKVAHVVLFGSPEDEIDWTTFPVDSEEDDNDPEGGGDGSDSPSSVRWGKDSKCYTIAVEQTAVEVENHEPFGAKWSMFCRLKVRSYVLAANVAGTLKVAPLQILKFPVVFPHKFLDAEKFNLRFSDASEITEIADKLRWYRYQKGLRQRDAADYAGIDRSTYIHYEEAGRDFYPKEHMEKLAELFEVPLEDLLDDHNLFLLRGQGAQIKAIRQRLGLTQKAYATQLGVSLGNLKHWEQNRKQIFKSTWEKYFKQGLEKSE